jgi:hypothetical protein
VGTPTLVLIAVTTLAACISLGGALYEALVVDPFWPSRPGIIQTHNGGISRVRFWLPVHTLLRLPLVLVTCAAVLVALALG